MAASTSNYSSILACKDINSSRLNSTNSTAQPLNTVAKRVRDLASKGGARNVLQSISSALSKVGQFANQVKTNMLEHLQNNPSAYFAAALAVVGLVAVSFFVPPVGVAALAGVALLLVAGAHEQDVDRRLDAQLVHHFGLKMEDHPPFSNLETRTRGLLVRDIQPNSVLAFSSDYPDGIQKSDRITEVNGQTVYSKRGLLNALEKARAEGETTLTINRSPSTSISVAL